MTGVSVVIPTVGRSTLHDAVASALAQTFPILEVVVVADTRDQLELSDDPRIRIIRVGPGVGASNARQAGVRASFGDVIALLDDDDLWHPYKLERQLEAVAELGSRDLWVASCRAVVRKPSGREKVLPKRTINSDDDVAAYLYTYRVGPAGVGVGMLQTSTLCFPRRLAMENPLNADADAIHDESTWLLAVRAQHPDISIIQISDAFSIYNVADHSVSRTTEDNTAAYVSWGAKYLDKAGPRVRGDYFFFSPVAAAVSAQSYSGLALAVGAGLRHGRPGPWSTLYAAAKVVTVASRSIRSKR